MRAIITPLDGIVNMKVTNVSKAPTIIYPKGLPSGVMLDPGQSYEGDFEDGQAAAHADDTARLTVEGYKPGKKSPPAATAKGDDKALAAALADVERLTDELATMTAANEALVQQLADLGEDEETDPTDDLRKQAVGLGIKVDKRWSDETIQRKIDEKLAS